MTIAFADLTKNAMLDAFETEIGASAVLKLRTGAPPGIGNADAGTVIATLTLPSDWMAAAGSGSKAKAGTWQDVSADNPGTVGHFRIYTSGGSVQKIEGTVTSVLVGTGDMLLDNDVVAAGQNITISGFTLSI